MALNIEQSFETRREKEAAFLVLAERFRAEPDTEEMKRLGYEVGRLIFGD